VNGEWEDEFSEDRLADTGLGLHACEAPDADVDSEVEGARSDRGSGSRPTVTHISAVLIFGCAGAGGSDDEDCMIRGASGRRVAVCSAFRWTQITLTRTAASTLLAA
jgi:hypothetical protein